MSRKKFKRKSEQARSGEKAQAAADTSNTGRRKFIALGLGGLGALAAGIGYQAHQAGWFGSATPPRPFAPAPPASDSLLPNLATNQPLPPVTLPADLPNALRAADEIVRHYARELNNPSTLIHAVRAFGKGFTLHDGSRALELLCARVAAEREINGQRYVYFPRDAEVHDNSFLKTMLEAGVSLDQTITAGGNKYTLRELGESAKALFRCDPQNFARFDADLLPQHLPWGLIAFSMLVPPTQAAWTNAYGESINLPAVIDRSLAVYESTHAGVGETIARGELESLDFRREITKYSCFGMHTFYGYFACLKHGYRANDLPQRLQRLCDTLVLRMAGDAAAIDRESNAVQGMGPEFVAKLAVSQDGRVITKGAAPANLVEVMRLRHQIRALGHALEAINYALLHQLFPLTPDQKQRLQAGEQLLYENLVKLRAVNLQAYLNWNPKFVTQTVIAVAHASRALKLLTPDNPDTAA